LGTVTRLPVHPRIASSAYQKWPTWSSRFRGADQRSSRAARPPPLLAPSRRAARLDAAASPRRVPRGRPRSSSPCPPAARKLRPRRHPIHVASVGGGGRRRGGGRAGAGWDESVRLGAGSQWIVAARPLCHLQCPVAYLSRLQRILPAARLELRSRAAARGRYAAVAPPATRALGVPEAPYHGSGGERRARAPLR
jgi:hypothetical protein